MRTLSTIHDKWASGGPFIGDRKPVTRCTVQKPWPDLANNREPDRFLRKAFADGMGKSLDRGYPARWYQRMDNSQLEMEIPNISNVSIDRSIDNDAATFDIEIKNQWMYVNGQAPTQAVLGQPGFFSPTRGNTSEAKARWDHDVNEWNGVLVPNAVIRVYTGFGGDTGTIEEQVDLGNLTLYGVFLVDEVSVTSSASLSIRGRDMMKLLIDQQLFPPLVPHNKYPLGYYRWSYEDRPVENRGRDISTGAVGSADPGDKRTIYRDSAVDRWYGHNASIYGHRATDCLDGNPHTYALSVGNSYANKPFATDWWEFDCGEEMNAVFVHPWAGNYHMYVSVMVGGVWQDHPDPPADDGGVIPYDSSHLFATQSPAVDTGANIPYVGKYVVPHERSGEYVLSQTYNAERVRVTFRNHVYSGLGVWKYRVGMREFRIRGADVVDSSEGTSSESGPTVWWDTWVQSGGARYVPNKSYSQGYLTVGRFGDRDSFGDARWLKQTNEPAAIPPGTFSAPSAVRYNNEGTGYYVLSSGGTITTYGDAVFYGDPITDGVVGGVDTGFFWDMAVTHTGEGYWILDTEGYARAYGDAIDFGVQFPIFSTEEVETSGEGDLLMSSIEACPYAMGFWVLRGDGHVFTAGAAQHLGNVPLQGPHATDPDPPPNAMHFTLREVDGLDVFVNASESAQCIRATKNGEGYWILTTKGRVLAFGNAINYGQPHTLEDHAENLFMQCYWEILPSPEDDGYLLLNGSGKVSAHGNIENFGGPIPGGERTLRSDGNYLDYVDIVKDLIMWSGFLLYDPNWPDNLYAPLYAGLETTGAFAKERLPDEMFDKKPVIDAITSLKEVVGYIVYVDSQGRFIFRSPNWWHIGNFFEDGSHVEYLLDIDERLQLTSYQVSTADEPVRSSIIISSHDPYADYSGTLTSYYTPPSAPQLRGLVKPAMWVNDHFIDEEEQEIMAELIGLHITFQERVGQVECYAHPGLEIDDQIRIFERQTGETYVHYVRGIGFSHNLDSGDYKMTLTTHWLAAGAESGDVVGGERLPVSSLLAERIQQQQFGKLNRETTPGVTS